MRKYTRVLLVLFLFLLIFSSMSIITLKAEETQDNTILLIDNSSSMQRTDPGHLSIVAASMLLDTIKPSNNINIIAFGEKVISPYRLKDKPSHELLKSSLSTYGFKDNWTNLKDGLKEALNQLSEVKGTKRIIILSDGKEDPKGGLTQSHSEELSSLIDNACTMKVKIYTVGLSDYADAGMLNNMAYSTGGTFFSCGNPADLFDIFGKVLETQENLETVYKYITDKEREKTLNFSSYIDEIVIKVASIDNRIPEVEVTLNGEEEVPDKEGNRYKIYDIKNDKNSSLKIKSLNNTKNMVIVQMKSRAILNASTTDESFQIPCMLPLKINSEVEGASDIPGLYLKMIEGGEIKTITKEKGAFSFTFQKNVKGQYPVFLTAYDGNNNIIAVRSIDISVVDDPPFYYTEEFPNKIITEKPFLISIKQLNNPKIPDASGDIIVNYGDEIKSFPLSLKDGILSGEVKFEKAGDIKLTACVRGTYNNDSFSYYLPNQRFKVIDRPVIDLTLSKTGGVLKQNTTSILSLQIKNCKIYKNEEIKVLDKGGKKIGEFLVKPGQKGEIKVKLTPTSQTTGLNLFFKGEEDLKLTEAISTNIKVLLTPGYYIERGKIGIIAFLLIVAITAALVFTGRNIYKNEIENYSNSVNIYYKIGGPRKLLNIELSNEQRRKYLNLNQDSIREEPSEEKANNAIGYFELEYPKYHPILIGLIYLLRKESTFKIIYNQIMDQSAFIDNEESGFPVPYQSGVRIELKHGEIKAQIDF